jgi:NAD(P)-dependent dehydrogenase (short-subunit alcohol dehydrogenase family)
MDAKTAIVTGANGGLGLACVRALLARDPAWHVVLAVRDPSRGHDATVALGEPTRCTVMALDLASLASVRGFVEGFAEAGLPPARALVCNAGIQTTSGTHLTADGIELTFGVNHLGHFALVQGLLDRLSTPARIVVVSSDTHDPRKLTGMPAPCYTSAAALAHPQPPPDGPAARPLGRRRYTTSKLCNVLFAYELDRRLGGGARGIAVNAFNPGLMPGSGSGLARDYRTPQRLAWRFLLPALRVLPQVRGVRRSGEDLAALAGDSEYAGISGRYFDGRRQIDSSADSYDMEKARDLWETSECLAGTCNEIGNAKMP